ncbi:MAG: hypothetical protein RR311_15285 [Comamonas sp.]
MLLLLRNTQLSGTAANSTVDTIQFNEHLLSVLAKMPMLQTMTIPTLLRALTLGVLVILLSACARTRHYTETFSTLGMSSDSSMFVVLGDQYHYIFETDSIMASSLSAGFRRHLTAEMIRPFNVGAGGKTAGYVRLQLAPDATAQDKAQARKLGYGETQDGLIYYTAFMVGSRYVPRQDTAPASAMALSKRYQVEVMDSQSSADAMRLLSPIYMAAGVGLVVASPAVLLVTLPVGGLKP